MTQMALSTAATYITIRLDDYAGICGNTKRQMKLVNVKYRLPVCLKPMVTGGMINAMQTKLDRYGFNFWHRFFYFPVYRAIEIDDS